MKPEIHLPWVNSGKISLGKTMFPRAKVRGVTTANMISFLYRGCVNDRQVPYQLNTKVTKSKK